MRRRDFLRAVGLAATAWSGAAHSQTSTTPVVGFLGQATAEIMASRLDGFRQGLKEIGFLEGKNISILLRFADNNDERLTELADDLVKNNVAVIFAPSPRTALAAKAAAPTTPVVFISGDNPVRLGLVKSLARPEGNLTGINFMVVEVAAKRIELLRELLPQARRIAVIANPADPITEGELTSVQTAAASAGFTLQITNARTIHEIDDAFVQIGKERPDAIYVATGPFLNNRRVQLVQLAAGHRLAAAYGVRDFVEAGGLLSYGASIVDTWRLCGVYVGRILKGERPAEIPVQQPTKFELAINLKTASALGLTIPATILARADEVIE